MLSWKPFQRPSYNISGLVRDDDRPNARELRYGLIRLGRTVAPVRCWSSMIHGEPLERRVGAAPIVVAIAVVCSFALSHQRSAVPVAVAGVAALAYFARIHTSWALLAATIAIAIVPVYWAREIGFGIATTPTLFVGIILAPVAIGSVRRWRVVPLDIIFGCLAATFVASGFLNFAIGRGIAVGVLTGMVLPFATFRILTVPGAHRHVVACGIAAAGSVLAIVAMRERMGIPNPFFTLIEPGHQLMWARPQYRFGEVRAEGSFGHAIPFGLFLSLATILALSLAVRVRSSLGQLILVAAAIVTAIGLIFTLSRGPIAVLLFSLAAWTIFGGRSIGWAKALRAITVGAFVLLVSPAGSLLADLQSSASGSGEAATSARFRLDLFELVSDPRQFSLVGRAVDPSATGVSAAVSRRVGFESLDNEFVRVYVIHGLLGLAALIGVVISTGQVALRRGLDILDRAWAMSTLGVALGLGAVALLTQQATFFWIGIAVTASVDQAARESPRKSELRGAEALAVSPRLDDRSPATTPLA